MSNATIVKTTYWNLTNGSIFCADHLGASASAAIAARPKAKSWSTEFGKVALCTEQDHADWISDYGVALSDCCEICDWSAA